MMSGTRAVKGSVGELSKGGPRVDCPVGSAGSRLHRSRLREAEEPPEDAGVRWPLRHPLGSDRLIGVAELAAAAGVLIGLAWIPPGIAAAAGMALPLVGDLKAHPRAGDGHKHAAPWSTASRPPPAADLVPGTYYRGRWFRGEGGLA